MIETCVFRPFCVEGKSRNYLGLAASSIIASEIPGFPGYMQQTMKGDSRDNSFDNDSFYAKGIYEERFTKRRKIKEYLLKWKGYSSMNDASKLEADLEYDALVSDYTVEKKKKSWKKNSKPHEWHPNTFGSENFGGCFPMISRRNGHGTNRQDPPAKPNRHCHISSSVPKYPVSANKKDSKKGSETLADVGDEETQALKMLPASGQSGIEKGWIPEAIISTVLVAGLYKRHPDDATGQSND
uniref:Chromo domain-containing protein n=1 Tax=Setaria digitata TaxID=48799 RepID=A0A915PU78_9BILA